MSNRSLIKNLAASSDGPVELSGWVETLRDQKRIQFVILRDESGSVQVTYKREEVDALADTISSLTTGSFVQVKGNLVHDERVKLGGIEIQLHELTITSLAQPQLPIAEDTSIDQRLDWRFIDHRRPEMNLVFRVQTTLERAWRQYWYENDFIELNTPKLMGSPSESNAELFEMEYFELGKAYLAQSPQFYKQMAMMSGLGRIFEIGPAFRADPSFTSRHATEFTSIDMEVSHIESHEDIMAIQEQLLQRGLQAVKSAARLGRQRSRRSPQADFDLMALPGMARAGDRSRRDDDRQLMLEALLSARDVLYVSWCGRSVRDNSEQPPSVLVAQLRDEIDLLWGQGTASALTVAHPLQPFGSAYFTQGSGVSTYAHEWAPERASSARAPQPTGAVPAAEAAGHTPVPVLTLAGLARFLRRPVGTFFRERLQVHLDPPQSGWLDEELFALTGLDHYSLLDEALSPLPAALTSESVPVHAQSVVQRLRASGALPLAGVGQLEAAQLQDELQTLLQTALAERAGHVPDAPRVVLDWPLAQAPDRVHLQDAVSGLWQPKASDQPALLLLLRASAIARMNPKGPAVPLPDKLIEAWLLSLATSAVGRPVCVVVVGRNAVVRAPLWPQQQAQTALQTLLQAWCEGMRSPLPLPPAMALTWLPDKQVTEAMREAYEDGGFMGSTAVARQDPALHRCYPTLQALLADGRFEAWAAPVYEPLLAWTTQCEAEAIADPIGDAGGPA